MKEDLRKLVELIKESTGKTQEDIAIEMGYKKNYISEMLSPKGKVSDKFLAAIRLRFSEALKGYYEVKESLSTVKEDPVIYNMELPMGDIKLTVKDYIELWKMLYNKEEERGRELIAIIKDLAKGQNEIAEVLKPIKEKTEAIDTNLNQTHQQVLAVKDLAYITARQLDDQREALGLGLPGQKKQQPVPFVKKDKASAGQRQDGGKKDSRQ